jgi:hypothetical protein
LPIQNSPQPVAAFHGRGFSTQSAGKRTLIVSPADFVASSQSPAFCDALCRRAAAELMTAATATSGFVTTRVVQNRTL